MKVTLSKQCFSSALSRMISIADRKSSMQILSNVLISTEGSTMVRLAATDLNLSFEGLFPAAVEMEGSITLPAKTLHDIVRSMPEGIITLQVQDDAAEILCCRSRFRIMGLAVDDFPMIPDAADVEFFEIREHQMASMMDRCTYSISSDETRPHINGALFQGDGKILRMVTTDGHRLSKVETKSTDAGFYNFSMIIPQKGILEIRKLLDDTDQMVSIGSKDGSLFLRKNVEVEKGTDEIPAQTAEIVLVSKLIESEFPPYDQVIPKQQDKQMVVPRGKMLDALRRVSVVSSDRTQGVKFVFSEGSVEVMTDNPSVGEGTESVDIHYDGEAMEIGFNARYFVDVLSVLKDEEVIFELSGDLDPAVVRDQAEEFIGVVMPMRI